MSRGERALALLGLLLTPAACSSPVPVVVADPRPPAPAERVGLLVGALLSTDAAASAAAERRLLVLDPEERRALEAHAARIPRERDPRWLHVLDEQGLLEGLSTGERVAFLLWKAARPERSFAMRAEAGLVEQARAEPAALLAELARGTPPTEALAAALVVAGRLDALPALAARYLATGDEVERRVLAEALARLAGEDLRPRTGGTAEQRAADVAALLAAAPPSGGAGGEGRP